MKTNIIDVDVETKLYINDIHVIPAFGFNLEEDLQTYKTVCKSILVNKPKPDFVSWLVNAGKVTIAPLEEKPKRKRRENS